MKQRQQRRRWSKDPALRSASALADYLAAGHPITGHDHPLTAPGELLLAKTITDVWRFRAADVHYTTPGYVAFGRPAVLFTAALGHFALAEATRRRAEREAAPQWRSYGPHACLLTTHRALFFLDGTWETTSLTDIYDVQPAIEEPTLDLYYYVEPIRLTGHVCPG